MNLDLSNYGHVPTIQAKKDEVVIKQLAIQNYLKEHGIEKAKEELGLKIKEYPFTIHLKYDQLNSDMSKEEVRECRGLVLAKTKFFQVVSYGFKKFFNYGEGSADTIDWNTAKILEKIDGTCIMWYYNPFVDRWCVGTTGTAEGEGEVTNSVTNLPVTFRELFLRALEETVQRSDGVAKRVLNEEGFESYVNNNYKRGLTYIFELTSPSNTIVTPHKRNEVRLLTVRNCIHVSPDYLNEAEDAIMDMISENIAVPLAKLIFRGWETNIDKLKESFANMPFTEEGYVVVDANHNRIKLKNPTYVEAHFLKHKQKRHQIIKVIKQNESEEFIAAFPEKELILAHLQTAYDNLAEELDREFDYIKQSFYNGDVLDDVLYADKKAFAALVSQTVGMKGKEFTSYYFQRHQGVVENAKQYLEKYHDKKLYLHLIEGYDGLDK